MWVDPEVDRAVQRLAARRNHRLTTSELLEVGMTHAAIRARVKRGFLTRIKRGLYAIGTPTAGAFAAEAGAYAAAGTGAVVDRVSAAFVAGLTKQRPPNVQLTVVGRRVRSRHGVDIRFAARLDKHDIRTTSGMRVTSPALTILDVAGIDPALGAACIDEARAKGLVTPEQLRATIARYPKRKGAAALAKLLVDELISGGTRSDAERILRRLVRKAGLPEAETNVKEHGHRADFIWRDFKVIVEFDGFGTHQGRESFENDRATDRALTALGYRVLRVTWRQLTEQPQKVVAEISAAIAIGRLQYAA
jgi:very-short-patch-repair endonuclease/predicted transcriptional regulator of viral defense system